MSERNSFIPASEKEGKEAKSDQQRLELLRDELYQGPSKQVWETVCKILDDFADPKVGILYLKEHLAEWPDELRVARSGNIAFDWINADFELQNFEEFFGEKNEEYKKIIKNIGDEDYLSEWSKKEIEEAKVINKFRKNSEMIALIKHFDFFSTSFSRRKLSKFIEMDSLQEMTILHLGDNPIGLKGIKILASSDKTKKLNQLYLSNCDLNDSSLKVLSETENFKNLNILSLSNNDIGPEGIQFLVESEYLNKIQVLEINVADIGPAGVEALAEAENMNELTLLDIENNGLEAQDLQYLSDSNNLPKLRELFLGDNNLGQEGIRILGASENLQNLTGLYLAATGLDSDCISLLAGSQFFTELLRLDLSRNSIGYDGVKILATSEKFKKLKELSITEVSNDQIIIQTLKDSAILTGCKVYLNEKSFIVAKQDKKK